MVQNGPAFRRGAAALLTKLLQALARPSSYREQRQYLSVYMRPTGQLHILLKYPQNYLELCFTPNLCPNELSAEENDPDSSGFP